MNTVRTGQPALAAERYKAIIIDSLQFLGLNLKDTTLEAKTINYIPARQVIQAGTTILLVGNARPTTASGRGCLQEFVEYEHNSSFFYEIQLIKHFRPLHFMDL